jgi:hypothetical protein
MGPRDPSGIYPFNLLDLVRAAAWDAPNLPLFKPLAPASTEAPVAASAPAVGAGPWLQPLHELQRVAGTPSPNPSDPASPDEIAASLWTSNGSSAPGAPAAAGPYTGAAAASPYLGSSADADALDPARTRRLLERAKRDDDFVRWLPGGPSVRPAQPMQYVAPAADAPRPGAPTTGIDDPVDRPVPVNGPPASSPPQLPLFAAPRRPQGTYWSPLSPSGALLPATQASYPQPRAIGDLQPTPAPAPPPDVPLTVNNVVRSIATGVPIAGGLANKGNAAINAALAPLMNPLFEEKNQLKGDTWSERYRNSLDEQNAADQAFHAAHPKLDTGLQIGGGIAATAPLAATATGARLLGLTGSLPGMVVRSASSNAAISAADAAVRGQDVTAAAGIGGLLGAGAPVVGRVVGAAATPVIDRLRGIVNPSEEAARRAGSAVNRDIANGSAGLTPEQFRAGQPAAGTAAAPTPPWLTPSHVRLLPPPEPRLALPPPEPRPLLKGPPPGTEPSWEGLINAGPVPKGGQFAYRLWGGGTPRLGGFLAPNLPASKAEAISTLALPPKNTAENLSTVYMPEGTQIQSGNAAKAFGRPGGGEQIQLLQEIPEEWFGPGMPFWSK